ncbi:MAG TPA: hypothetical protein VN665_01975 [Candidatus Paceibacterota bacterium]|nr:hypothetical protein [Candidatus Paceibacterota bacterium]
MKKHFLSLAASSLVLAGFAAPLSALAYSPAYYPTQMYQPYYSNNYQMQYRQPTYYYPQQTYYYPQQQYSYYNNYNYSYQQPTYYTQPTYYYPTTSYYYPQQSYTNYQSYTASGYYINYSYPNVFNTVY